MDPNRISYISVLAVFYTQFECAITLCFSRVSIIVVFLLFENAMINLFRMFRYFIVYYNTFGSTRPFYKVAYTYKL